MDKNRNKYDAATVLEENMLQEFQLRPLSVSWKFYQTQTPFKHNMGILPNTNVIQA